MITAPKWSPRPVPLGLETGDRVVGSARCALTSDTRLFDRFQIVDTEDEVGDFKN